MKGERRADRIRQIVGTIGMGAAGSWVATFLNHEIRTIVIGGGIAAFLAVLIQLQNLPRIVGNLLGLEGIVISALVFWKDIHGIDRVLLLRDEDHPNGWLLPPSAHLRCFTSVIGGPHEVVVREIRAVAELDVEIDVAEGVEAQPGLGVRTLPQPFFVQSEPQLRGEGHAVHYDLYYIGHLRRGHAVTRPKGHYEWVAVGELHGSALPNGFMIPSEFTVPREMVQVIDNASASLNRRTMG